MQAGEEQESFLSEGLGILECLESQIEKWELERLLGGEYDEGDAMLSIQVCPAWKVAVECNCLSIQELKELDTSDCRLASVLSFIICIACLRLRWNTASVYPTK